MPLSDATRQRRRRERLKRQMQTDPRTIEAALLAEAECEEMSGKKRIALADKLADLAMDFQRRAIRLSKMGYNLRTGSDHPLQQ